jgi:Phage head-tail joining protein
MTTTPLLSAVELDSCRALQRMTMVETASIDRAITVSDGMGGWTETWSTVAIVPCRVGTPTGGAIGAERVVADRLSGETTMAVTFPAGTDVRRTDRLLIYGKTFEVLSVLAPHTYETARVTLCKVMS